MSSSLLLFSKLKLWKNLLVKIRMNNSSPSNSLISITAVAGGGVGGGGGGSGSSNAALPIDDLHYPSDPFSFQDCKDEALVVLKSDLIAALNKEVRSLDEDNWKFEGPRSRIHLISRPGCFLHKLTEISNQSNSSQRK